MDEPVNFFKWTTFIEPIAFLIAFSFGLSETVLTDEILLKTCEKVVEENRSTDCSSLSSLTSLQEIVQPQAATVLALKSFIENFVPAMVCIFLGSWCEVIGRKPILLIATTGTIIYYTSLALLSYFNINIYWYLAISFFTSLFGGFPVVIMACYIYATDTVEYVTFNRVNFVDLAILMGKLVGCLTYPAIIERFGYWLTYTISSYVCLLALIFTWFFLKETLRHASDNSVQEPLYVRMTDTVQKFFKWLNIYSSNFLWFPLLVIALHDDNIQGTSTNLYLYAQQFQWTLFDFSIYTAVYFGVTAVTLLLLSSKFVRYLPCNSVVLMSIGLISSIASAFTRSFAKSLTHLHVALGVGAFSWIPQYFTRNAVTEDIDKEDECNGLMATTALERIALSFIIPLNIYLCSNFITTYPHPVWLMQASLQLLTSLSICGLFIHSIHNMIEDDD